MEKLTKCCFCGKKFPGIGNDTRGCWPSYMEETNEGEVQRCCAKCFKEWVEPAREANYTMTGSFYDTSWEDDNDEQET